MIGQLCDNAEAKEVAMEKGRVSWVVLGTIKSFLAFGRGTVTTEALSSLDWSQRLTLTPHPH